MHATNIYSRTCESYRVHEGHPSYHFDRLRKNLLDMHAPLTLCTVIVRIKSKRPFTL